MAEWNKTKFLAFLASSIKRNRFVLIVAALHLCLTLYTDRLVFVAPRSEHLATYLMLKVLLYVVLCFLWKWVSDLLSSGHLTAKATALYALPYLLLLLGFFVYGVSNGVGSLTGDELNIFNVAVQYGVFPYHFTYLTGLAYSLSLMLIPCQMGVKLVKIVLQALVCGYVVRRSVEHFRSRVGLLAYGVFLLAPVIVNGVLIHRMQYYGLLYLLVIAKLAFDYLEGERLAMRALVYLLLAFSVLAFWRKEGLYLVLLAPLLIASAYSVSGWKGMVALFCSFWVVLGIVYSPQLLHGQRFDAEDTHTYNGWFVNMSRLGLDRERYPEEMEAVDRYLSLEAVDRINADLGDDNYQDEYIAWRGGYVGVRQDRAPGDAEAYKEAVTSLVLHEPLLFLRTRAGLWAYMASHAGAGTSLPGLLRLAFNLNVPLLAMVVASAYGAAKRRRLFALIGVGLLANTAITLLFAPAAYFKYYYQTYLIGWFFIAMAAMWLSLRLTGKGEKAGDAGDVAREPGRRRRWPENASTC